MVGCTDGPPPPPCGHSTVIASRATEAFDICAQCGARVAPRTYQSAAGIRVTTGPLTDTTGAGVTKTFYIKAPLHGAAENVPVCLKKSDVPQWSPPPGAPKRRRLDGR